MAPVSCLTTLPMWPFPGPVGIIPPLSLPSAGWAWEARFRAKLCSKKLQLQGLADGEDGEDDGDGDDGNEEDGAAEGDGDGGGGEQVEGLG